MKIYTRRGDSGETSLGSGERVSKSDGRVEMYGTADELNSFIGAAAAFMDDSRMNPLAAHMDAIQRIMFELGSELAGFKGAQNSIHETDVADLESWIDLLTGHLPPLHAFVLPGGSKPAAFLHMARSVCRRLERLMTGSEAGETSYRYVNRLSDYLFTASRYANMKLGALDIEWQSRLRKG